MESVLIYILQVNILLSFIYLGYVFLLKGLTFYRLNRVYFLLGSVYAVLFPFVDLGGWFRRSANVSVPLALEYIPFDIAGEPTAQFTLDRLLLGIVVLAGVVFLFRLIVQLLSLGRIHIHSQPAEWKGYLFRNVLFPIVPFSFFRKIYIHEAQHEEPELHDIFKHEAVHVKGLHSMDILWFEMLLIGCWYNPFVWLMRRAVRQNLEYLTDQQVLDKGMDRQTYQYSLLHVTQQGAAVGMGNHFNFRSLKRRIIMMNKRRSSRLELGKYAFLLPVLILAGASFTVSKAEKKIEEVVQKAEKISLDVMLLDDKVNRDGNQQEDVLLTKDETIDRDTANEVETGHLKGKVTGVKIDGKDSVGNKLVLVNSSKKPLFIVDGVKKPKYFDADIINPKDVYRMTIIKDKASLAIYGEEGNDGVILIETKQFAAKKGKNDKTLSDTANGQMKTDSANIINNIRLGEMKKDPLVIIDGDVQVIGKHALRDVDNADIESIEITTENAALEKFGSKAADGVIEVTTKSKKRLMAMREAKQGWRYNMLQSKSGIDQKKDLLYLYNGKTMSKADFFKLEDKILHNMVQVVGDKRDLEAELLKRYPDKLDYLDKEGWVEAYSK